MSEIVVICEWFARCVRPAVGVVAHPILDYVPCCQECADKLNLDLKPATFEEAT